LLSGRLRLLADLLEESPRSALDAADLRGLGLRLARELPLDALLLVVLEGRFTLGDSVGLYFRPSLAIGKLCLLNPRRLGGSPGG
jgi:hypothetical protein